MGVCSESVVSGCVWGVCVSFIGVSFRGVSFKDVCVHVSFKGSGVWVCVVRSSVFVCVWGVCGVSVSVAVMSVGTVMHQQTTMLPTVQSTTRPITY